MYKYPSSITLPNRYRLGTFFEHLQEGIYQLKGDLDYLFVIGMNKETKNVASVDSAGDPFISAGFVPDNGLIVTTFVSRKPMHFSRGMNC